MSRRKVARRRYTVAFEEGEQRGWIASVKEVPGCHTQGRSIGQARNRIREALSLWIGAREARVAEFDERLPLPASLRRTLAELSKLEARLEELRETEKRLRDLRLKTIHRLVEGRGYSYRDTAEVLGISHSRVEQLLNSRS